MWGFLHIYKIKIMGVISEIYQGQKIINIYKSSNIKGSIYDRETGEIETQSSKYGSGFSPTLSPDGKWLVYGSRYNDQTGLIARNLSEILLLIKVKDHHEEL